MQIEKRQIVRSLAGHDKGEFAVIVSHDDKYAYICDGKRRKLDTPKKKKIIHLAPTAKVLNEDEILTNRQIIKALAIYEKQPKPKSGRF